MSDASPEPSLYRQFGLNVAAARNRQGTTQLQLAGAVRLSRTSIANIEAGRQRVQIGLAYEIASALGVNVKELLPSRGPSPSSREASTGTLPTTLNRDRWVKSIKQRALSV